MSQLDNIPPIRLPEFTPFPMEDAFRGVSDSFKIRTPEADMLPSVAADADDAAAAPALTLTKTPPPGWVAPGVANREYAFCTFGTLDGFIPSGLDTHIAEIDTTSTTAAERRIYIKATWTPPVTIALGFGVSPLWDTVELLASPSAAINASVLPAQGAVDPNTGYRAFYIFPIGRVRWQQIGGTWQMVLQSDDRGSIRTYPRTQPGGMRAADGPDSPPVWGVNVDFIAVRGPVV